MYNGPYQTVRQLEERVEEVDDPLESLKVGSMVAVLLSNYRKFPVIGEVLAIDGEKEGLQGGISLDRLPPSTINYPFKLCS